MQIEKIKVSEIIPYEDNAKLHPERQVQQIKASINEFGFNDPIAIDENNVVIEGNGRLMAIKELGYEEVDCIRIEGLTEDQKRAYILVHNQLTMNTGFDIEILNKELERIKGIDMQQFDFELSIDFDNDIDTGDGNQYSHKVEIPQYEPTGECPDIWELVDTAKADSFLEEIQEANVSDEEKDFLIKATRRLYEFNYKKIAEYYAQATPEMQELMEHLALVIIDFDNAIAYGYAQLSAALEEMRGEDDEE
jgi:ParB-like chromosome segregation protein Spo0J